MNIFNNLEDNTLLIIPYEIKKKVLKNNQHLSNFKIISREELQKKLLFDYDFKTISYLSNKYNIKLDIAKTYIENMYYISNKKYKLNKLNKLNVMKQKLIAKKLLIIDNLFVESIKNYQVLVYGYDIIDNHFKAMLNSLNNSYKIIYKENNSKAFTINEFSHIEEEVNFIAYSISSLIKSGIDINKIKIGNINDDYLYLIKRIFSFYNIPLNTNELTKLYSKTMILSFLKYFDETKDLSLSLDKISKEYDLANPDNLDLYNQIIFIINNNSVSDMESFKYIFKHTNTLYKVLDNAVDIINLNDNYFDDEYVFIMNFNQGSMPIVNHDEDYITDLDKVELNLEDTPTKNVMEEEKSLKIIKSIKHLTITYKLRNDQTSFYPSSLVEKLNVEVINNPIIDVTKSYSKKYDDLTLSKKLDTLVKYDEVEDDLEVLFNNNRDIPYSNYDNKFKELDNTSVTTYINHKLSLSYSSIDDYFKCAFKYYIKHILRLEPIEETFQLFIGNLFHYVLSKAFDNDFDFDKVWIQGFKEHIVTPKEAFFLVKLKEELKSIIKLINEQNKLSKMNEALYEQRISVSILNHKIPVLFNGFIDKIKYMKGHNDLVSIIDYKTGSADINLDKIKYGLNMQLPSYLYLVSNYNVFNNPKFVGFYLQEILHNEIAADHKHTYEEIKKNELKLSGYTINNESLINIFDESYADSRVIKSMKLTKDGFYAYTKVIDEEGINNLISLVGLKIDEASDNIIDASFNINPKVLDGKNVSCEYCKFNDICYLKERDKVMIGGETDE